MEVNNSIIDKLLPRVKETELEILSKVDEFCREHDIKYSLAYGTLLGAVRHKGFIPWDDDIDIMMLREDYNKFIKLWNKNPIDGYILQNKDNSPDFSQTFTKIRKDHTTFINQAEADGGYKYHKGFFIDIFPLDRKATGKFNEIVQNINAIKYLLLCREYLPKDNGLALKLASELFLLFNPKFVRNNRRQKYLNRITKYNSQKNNRLLTVSAISDLRISFIPELMENSVDLYFEGKKFMCTWKYLEFLESQYGDYMQLPPEAERVWYHHPVIVDVEHNFEEINK